MKVKSKLSDTANNYLKHTKKQKGITLIALVITIVLNCCEAAMARVNNKEINILKI